MKKVVSYIIRFIIFILILLLLYFCLMQFLTTSTSFCVDESQLDRRPNYIIYDNTAFSTDKTDDISETDRYNVANNNAPIFDNSFDNNNNTSIVDNSYDDSTKDDVGNLNNEEKGSVNLFVLLYKFLQENDFSWIWEVIPTLIGFIIGCVYFNKSSRVVKKVYTRKLKHGLFPKEHLWYGNNEPKDIYVSVRVFLTDTYKKEKNTLEYKEEESKNILDYIKEIVLKKPAVYAVIGNAGEGKTFSLSNIAMFVLDNYFSKSSFSKISTKKKKAEKKIPIIINFPDIVNIKTDSDFITYIYNTICLVLGIKRDGIFSMRKKKMMEVIKRYIAAGNFMIMIDGYDEITNKESRLECSKFIIEIMTKFHKCIYIITSRKYIYENEPFPNIPIENTLYLSPLSKEQIHTFLRKWWFPTGKSNIELYNRIIGNFQIQSVISNPLLLTMIAHIYSVSDVSFSQNKAQLYSECISCLLKRWEDEKAKRKRIKRFDLVDVDVKIKLLSMFANYLYENNIKTISKTSLSNLFASHPLEISCFHGKSLEVINDMLNQSGLLEEIGESQIGFRHRSFYEYFTALYWAENDKLDISRFDNIESEQNLIFFYFAMVKNEDIVCEFVNQNLKHTRLVTDILIERKLMRFNSVECIIDNLLDNLNYKDVSQLQTIGYLVRQYPNISNMVVKAFSDKLAQDNNNEIKANIIIGLMTFGDKKMIKRIFSAINMKQIDFKILAQYSGEALDKFAVPIITTIGTAEKKENFIEQLALNYRFSAIYNIYLSKNAVDSTTALIGLLYMSRELELFKQLENANFCSSVDGDTLNSAHKLLNDYGWAGDELDEKEKLNLFLLIHLYLNNISNNNHINNQLLHNRVGFLLCYITSSQTNEITTRYIHLDDIVIKSTNEFTYHWNRRMYGKRKSLTKTVGTSIRRLNSTALFITIALSFVQILYYTSAIANINELSFRGFDITLNVLNNLGNNIVIYDLSSYLYATSLYFAIYIGVNKLIKLIDYNQLSRLLTVLYGIVFIFVYCIFIYNLVFRIINVCTIIFMIIIEILKHRNNYPSFKEPQYSRLVEYIK